MSKDPKQKLISSIAEDKLEAQAWQLRITFNVEKLQDELKELKETTKEQEKQIQTIEKAILTLSEIEKLRIATEKDSRQVNKKIEEIDKKLDQMEKDLSFERGKAIWISSVISLITAGAIGTIFWILRTKK